MIPQRADAADAFSASAAAYARTMAPALRPVAEEVVRRARLAPGERVLDVGTGTGTAASLAVGGGRRVIGVDAAAGMLELARRDVPSVEFVEADFGELPFPDASTDVVLAVHALLFAEDRLAVLREWRRVLVPGGRLSISVPGPGGVVPAVVLGAVYDRYGMPYGDDYPTLEDVVDWAELAGWSAIDAAADATAGIPLADDEAFRTWLEVGSRGRLTAEWSEARREAFARELMAASPRDANGGYWLPFGALYLSARR